MNKKIIILLIIGVLLLSVGYKAIFNKQNQSLSSSSLSQKTQVLNTEPSKVLKNYSDPSGFSFNYPDNLSVLNNELKDVNSYAQLQLTSKDSSGNLLLNITDSKFKTIEDWTKTFPNTTPKEVTLGSLKAMEIENNGKILLGALDSGIFFNIEANLADPANGAGKKDYWKSVYASVIKDFAFVSPSQTASSGGSDQSDDVSFDSEEVVE